MLSLELVLHFGPLTDNQAVSGDTVVKLVEQLVKLVGILIWPAVVVFVVLRFGRSLSEFFSSLGEFTLKAAGFEATARAKAEAVAALTAAAASRVDVPSSPEDTAQKAKAAARVVAETVTPSVIRRAGRATILWVDDRPNNNVHERQSIEALGVNFVLSTSTEDALEKLNHRTFDAIISDMDRPPDPRAGYTLLDKLRARGDQTPFIIYAGSRSAERREESKRHGALGCTNRPDELFEMVLSALDR
jgi:CheY-like chemotaxis protein